MDAQQIAIARDCLDGAYANTLSFPESADVGLAIDRLGNSSVTYRLGIFREGSDAPAAEGEFTHVYVDRVSRRPKPLPEDWREKLGSLL